jgi:hypothetical protein
LSVSTQAARARRRNKPKGQRLLLVDVISGIGCDGANPNHILRLRESEKEEEERHRDEEKEKKEKERSTKEKREKSRGFDLLLGDVEIRRHDKCTEAPAACAFVVLRIQFENRPVFLFQFLFCLVIVLLMHLLLYF